MRTPNTTVSLLPASLLALSVALTVGCGSDDIDSDTEARLAYTGFDAAVDKAINLGFDGFSAASSANIPDQSGTGEASGTIVVGGQVDQGAADNKEMRLLVDLVEYSDGVVADPDSDTTVELTYATVMDAPIALTMSLRDVPNGTFTGTMIGTLALGVDIESDADFNLALSGNIEEDPADASAIRRTAGTLVITGTVVSGEGTFDVDITR